MRCSTPGMRSLLQSFHSHVRKSRTNGNALRNTPIAKSNTERRTTLRTIGPWAESASIRFRSASAIDTPTRNKKNGNTRSVGVHPCHSAWSSGA